MKKILVIDGQGGKLGRLIIEQLRLADPLNAEIMAVGTNSIATSTMLKAGADSGATGENPVVVACRDADIIVGPIGIIATDALYGEVTGKMAMAVGACRAQKILLPVSRCRISVMGIAPMSTTELITLAVQKILAMLK